MNVRVRCGQCANDFLIGQEYAGQTVACPICGSLVAFPGPGWPVQSPPAVQPGLPPGVQPGVQPMPGPTPYYPPPAQVAGGSLWDEWAAAEAAAPALSSQQSGELPAGQSPLLPLDWPRRRFRMPSVANAVPRWLLTPLAGAALVAAGGLLVYLVLRRSPAQAVSWSFFCFWIAVALLIAGWIWQTCILFKRGTGTDIAVLFVLPIVLALSAAGIEMMAGQELPLLEIGVRLIGLMINIYSWWWIYHNWRWVRQAFGFSLIAVAMTVGSLAGGASVVGVRFLESVFEGKPAFVDRNGEPGDSSGRAGSSSPRPRFSGSSDEAPWQPHSTAEIQCSAMAPGLSELLCGHGNRTLVLWKLPSLARIRTVGVHERRITAVEFGPGPREALSADDEGVVRRWDIDSAREIRRDALHRGAVRALAVSPADRSIFSAGVDRTIVQWEPDTGRVVRRFEGHLGAVNSLALSGDGRWLVSGANDGAVRIWEVATGQLRRQFDMLRPAIPSVAISGDGRYVAGCSESEVRIWNVADEGEAVRRLHGRSGDFTRVRLSWSGRYAATAGQDRTVRLWQVATANEDFRLDTFSTEVVGLHYSFGTHLLAMSSSGVLRARNVPPSLVDDSDPLAKAALASATQEAATTLPPMAAGVAPASPGGKSGEKSAPAAKSPSPPAKLPSPRWAAGDDAGDALANLRIPLKPGGKITFGESPCPVIVVGDEVWSVSTAAHTTTFQDSPNYHHASALSREGRWFAAAASNDNVEWLGVWSTETGRLVFQTPVVEDGRIALLAIAREKYVLVGLSLSTRIFVWEIESGKAMPNIILPNDVRFRNEHVTFTPDGAYHAVISDNQVVVCATDTSRKSVVMDTPGQLKGAFRPGSRRESSPASPASGRSSLYSGITEMRFSPDGEELAAISTHPQNRIIVWNRRGKVVFNQPLALGRQQGRLHNRLQWQPDGSGWRIGSVLYDRPSRRVVLRIKPQIQFEEVLHLADKDHLVSRFRRDAEQLDSLTIPWTWIQKSLTAMSGESPARLKPGKPVSIRVESASLRGDDGEVARLVTQALTQRLARDGFSVEPGQSTWFRIILADEVGAQRPLYSENSPFDFSGGKAERSPFDTKDALVVDLWTEGRDQPWWRETVEGFPARSLFEKSLGQRKAREDLLDRLYESLRNVPFPYFIPQSDDLLPLPILVE